MDGFLLINKPTGMTSHDVVFKLKKQLKMDKIGHTGTLDPFASGLMILCLGKATKLAYFFENLDKFYEGTIVFGRHYDTFDTTGTILDEKENTFTEDNLDQAMASFIGGYDQVPPMYSALKVQGRKLYELARAGKTVERASRAIDIYAFQRINPFEMKTCDFLAHVSKGTYIRSLAVDLADKLETFGALSRLKRLSVGPYHLKDAKTLDEVAINDILSLADYVKTFPSITLNEYMIKLVKNGVYLDERQTTLDRAFTVKDINGQLIALYDVTDNNQYKPVVIF